MPVNPASAPPELRYLLEDSGATVFVYDPAVAAAVDAARAAGLPRTTGQVLSLPELADLAARAGIGSDQVPDAVTESDDALILYTSGTTGRPKGALFDHHRVMWANVNFVATCGHAGRRPVPARRTALPRGGAVHHVMPGTMIGATHVVLPGFDPGKVLDALASERITMFFGVPTMSSSCCGTRTRRGATSRHGAPACSAPPRCGERGRAAHRHLAARALHAAVRADRGRAGRHLLRRRAGQGAPDATAAGPAVHRGPRGRPRRQRRRARRRRRADPARRDDNEGLLEQAGRDRGDLRHGWLHTGDLARIDADGYLTLVDRLKDMIITAGRKVYSVEVERALAAHPGIGDVAVVGRPHPDYGESIVAVIAPREGTTVPWTTSGRSRRQDRPLQDPARPGRRDDPA